LRLKFLDTVAKWTYYRALNSPRVHAVSPGPLKTRAASRIANFDELQDEAEHRAPEHDLVDILDIGATAAFLCSPFAKLITGGTIFVDGGYNIRG
jgi:enoyl-[acyl-carrier protein] reductase I